MDREIHQRLLWVKLYEECNDAGFVCRRCGISRPTLRKWIARYKQDGIAGLKDHSKRPRTSPSVRVTSEIRELILDMRRSRNLSARRLQTESIILHEIVLVHPSTCQLNEIAHFCPSAR